MPVDTVDRQAVELIQRAHPFRVTSGEVVVDRYHVDALLGQCVQEYGKRCHEGFTLAGCHFGDFTFVQDHSAEQLAVVVDHIPRDRVAAGHPAVTVNGFVSVDTDEVLFGGQVAVEICRGHYDLAVLCKTAARIFHDSERFGQDFVEFFLDFAVDLLGQMVYLARYILFVVERRVYVLQLSLQFDDLCFIAGYVLGDGGLQRSAARTQLVIGKLLYERINRLDLFYIRLDFLAVLLAFCSEEQFQHTGNYTHNFCCKSVRN